MTGGQTAAASLCFPTLVVAFAGLGAGPSHGAGYWCLAVLWNVSWLFVLHGTCRRLPRLA